MKRDWYMVQLDWRYRMKKSRFYSAKHPTPCAPPRPTQEQADDTDLQVADMISEGCPHHNERE